jgi:hypothetical protein
MRVMNELFLVRGMNDYYILHGFILMKKNTSIKIKKISIMGSTTSQSQTSYEYEKVEDIPDGTTPPSASSVIERARLIAADIVSKSDPIDLQTCRECMKQGKVSEIQSKVDKIEHILSDYDVSEPGISERTVKFKLNKNPEVWLSSTKNSDSTISYWVQYPIEASYIQAAMLQLMNLPVNYHNMHEITKKYEALYTQLLHLTQNEVVKCEQIDSVFMDLALKSLLLRHYQPYQNK